MSKRGLKWLAAQAEKQPTSIAGAGAKARLVDRGDWIALALIAALSAYVRWRWTAGLPAILHPDSDSYFEIAKRLWDTGTLGDLSRRTPLYPLLLWATGRATRIGFDLTLLVQHALGVSTALLTYLTARSVLRYRVPSLFAGLTVAAAPVLILTEHSILTESLYTFFIVAAGYLLIVFLRPQRVDPGRSSHGVPTSRDVETSQPSRDSADGGRAITGKAPMAWRTPRIYGMLCGVALGAACLTRPVGALIAVTWLVAVLALRGWRVAGRFASSAGVTCLLVLLPLLIRNQREVGSFSLTQSTGRNLISVTDLMVDYAASGQTGKHKDVLQIYHRYLANKRGPDAVVVYSAMPELRRAVNGSADMPERFPDVQIDRMLAHAAWQAVLLHPLDYLRERLARLPLLFDDPAKSQWYALHLETYVPLIEFTGKQNPEMTSRTVVNHPLKEIDFPRAASALERWRFPFDSPWFLALEALGVLAAFAGVIAREKSSSFASLGMTAKGSGMAIFLAVAASLLAAILMQPPNLRYRIPTLPWEIVLAAAGLALVADLTTRGVAELGKKSGREIPCWIPNVAVCLAAIGWFATEQVPLGASAIKVGDFVDSANQPADGPAIIRQMPLAGKTAPMIYWRTDMPAPRTIRAETAVDGGGLHRLRAAFSCGDASCAGARLRLVSFNALGAAIGNEEMPLARERTDNDLFWEQIDERVTLPRGAAKVRFEISFEPGSGSLVIPFLNLTK